jgi:F like protein
MQHLVDAANDLAALLEAAAPAQGLRHPLHAKSIGPARKAVEKVMRSYFRRQEAALLNELKPKLGVLVHRESSEAHTFSSGLLASASHVLRLPVTSSENDVWVEALSGVILGAAATIVKDFESGTISAEDIAGRYLTTGSLTRLTGGLNQTSLQVLRDAISDAWDAGGSFEQIVAAIQDTFETFSTTRAERIAQTEVNDAYNYGRVQTAVAAGFDQKAWDPDGEACPICTANADEGWIGIDETFSSGDSEPTAHPNCDCSVDFRKGVEDN